MVAIEKATNVWVDHCEFYNDGIVGDKDLYDGLLDVILGSDFITISWNKFHDHVSFLLFTYTKLLDTVLTEDDVDSGRVP